MTAHELELFSAMAQRLARMEQMLEFMDNRLHVVLAQQNKQIQAAARRLEPADWR